MRVDTSRIDERIKKLEEVKRIASDPELVEMLLEFLGFGQELPKRYTAAVQSIEREPNFDPSNDAGDLIDQVLKSVPESGSRNGRR